MAISFVRNFQKFSLRMYIRTDAQLITYRMCRGVSKSVSNEKRGPTTRTTRDNVNRVRSR